jgi:hypothetical protein
VKSTKNKGKNPSVATADISAVKFLDICKQVISHGLLRPNIQNGKISSSSFKKMYSGSEGSRAVVLNLLVLVKHMGISFVLQQTTIRIEE